MKDPYKLTIIAVPHTSKYYQDIQNAMLSLNDENCQFDHVQNLRIYRQGTKNLISQLGLWRMLDFLAWCLVSQIMTQMQSLTVVKTMFKIFYVKFKGEKTLDIIEVLVGAGEDFVPDLAWTSL